MIGVTVATAQIVALFPYDSIRSNEAELAHANK